MPIGTTPGAFLAGAPHGKEEDKTNRETGRRCKGKFSGEEEGSID